MSTENKAVVKRFYEAISAGRLEIVNELVADDFVEHEVFPGLEPNRDGVVKMFAMMREAISDFQMTIDDMVAEGDKVFIRGRMTGTHTGDFAGMPATGKPIDVPFGDFVRFKSGRVVEHWGVTDTGAMMQQMGTAT